MKRISLLLAIIAIFGMMYSCGNKTEHDMSKMAEVAKTESKTATPAVSGVKKYTLKSGIVEYSYKIEQMEHKEVVSFDDFGMKECKDTYEEGALKSSQFSDGVKIYKVIYKDKAAYAMSDASRGTEFKCDWSEISEKDKAKGNATKLPNINILGKDCEHYSIKMGDITTTFAGWGGVLLMMGQQTKYGNTVQQALKFEENVAVSPDKFKVPAGFAVKASGM